MHEQPVHAGDADVGDASRGDPWACEHRGALVGDRQVGGAGGDDHDALGALGVERVATRPCCRPDVAAGCAAKTALACASSARVSSTGASRRIEQLADDGGALLGGLARP